MRGCPVGRSLVEKIRLTASGIVTSAASPYTVSVGIATRPPLRSTSTARDGSDETPIGRVVTLELRQEIRGQHQRNRMTQELQSGRRSSALPPERLVERRPVGRPGIRNLCRHR